MAAITNIAIHHSGGLANNPLASTKYLTFEQIEHAHKLRWNFRSSMDRYAGYNIMIDTNGAWRQSRAVGEETAAQRGFNLDTMSIMLMGNFTYNPTTGKPVDTPTDAQVHRMVEFCFAAMQGKLAEQGIRIKPGTTLSFALSRIYAHRFFQQTECYGTSLTDSWAREHVIAKYTQQIYILKQIVLAYTKILELVLKSPVRDRSLAANDRTCEGFITL